MLPDITVLLALLMGLSALGATPAQAPTHGLIGTAVLTLTTTWLIASAGRRGKAAVADGELPLADAGRRWTTAWAFIGFATVIWAFDWGGVVAHYVPRIWWMGTLLVIFLPAFWLFAFAWRQKAKVERAILAGAGRPIPPGVDRPIKSGIGRNSVIVLPIFLVYAITEGVWVAGQLGVEPMRVAAQWIEVMPLLSLGVVIGLVLLALPFIPWILQRVLGAQSFPEGPLRRSLERGAQRIGLGYHDIVLWRTNNSIANAMVVGFTRGTRRIFLTDALVNSLTEDETMAVFFHEAGHAKKWHLPLFLVIFISLSLLFHGMQGSFVAVGIPPLFVTLIYFAVIWFVVLGFVSRRFEREADLYGAEHASILDPDAPAVDVPGLSRPIPRGAALMIRALDRVRQVSGRGTSHRHGTIDSRMAYIASHATNPSVREAWHRDRRNLLLGIGALFLGAVALTVMLYPSEVAVARAMMHTTEGEESYTAALALRRDDKVDEAKPRWEAAYASFLKAAAHVEDESGVIAREVHVRVLFNAADTALHGLQDAARAKPHFEAVLAALKERRGPLDRSDFFFFQSHIELGRIAAWMSAERTVAEEHLKASAGSRLLRASRDDLSEKELAVRAYFNERRRLLGSTIEARLGGPEGATLARAELALLTGSANKADEWREIREDAQIELDRLDELGLGKPKDD